MDTQLLSPRKDLDVKAPDSSGAAKVPKKGAHLWTTLKHLVLSISFLTLSPPVAAGEITTTSLLDREAKSEYILIVRAVDGGVGHHQKTGIAMVSVGGIPISCCPPEAGIVESCSVSFLLCEEPTVVPALCATPAAAPKIIVQVVQTLKSACFPGKPFTQEPPGFPEPVGVAVSPTPPAERSLCFS